MLLISMNITIKDGKAAPLAVLAGVAGMAVGARVAKAMFDDFNFSSYSEPNYPSLNPVIVGDKK